MPLAFLISTASTTSPLGMRPNSKRRMPRLCDPPWSSVHPIAAALLPIGMQRLDVAVGVVGQLGHLDRTQVGDAARQHRIVIERVPLPAELADRVVRGPADEIGR